LVDSNDQELYTGKGKVDYAESIAGLRIHQMLRVKLISCIYKIWLLRVLL